MVAISSGVWAAVHGADFFVDQAWSTDPYYSGWNTTSGWNQFFLPLGRQLISKASPVIELSCGAVRDVYWPLEVWYPTSAVRAFQWRSLASAAVRRWLKIRPNVTRLAQREWARASAGAVAVLGVHMRGTDKRLRRVIPPSRYFAFIKRLRCSASLMFRIKYHFPFCCLWNCKNSITSSF